MSIQIRSQSGRVALVTGSSRGIGAGIATRLARQGAHVVINYRAQKDAAERVVEQLGAQGFMAEARQADVADPSQVAELFRAIQVNHGRLDILVNNAGINRDGSFLSMELDQWDAVFATNLRGAFVCAKHAARLMLQPRFSRSRARRACRHADFSPRGNRIARAGWSRREGYGRQPHSTR